MKITAACGNDCAKCPRYTSFPYEKTNEELHQTADLWYKIGYRDHVASNDEIACSGCKISNWCRYGIVVCVNKRNIHNCSECLEYPCSLIKSCFEATESFRLSCEKNCSKEEYIRLLEAFFEKEKNLK